MAIGKTNNKHSLWKEIARNKDKYLMMLPFSLFFLLFTVISVIAAIVLSFTNFNLIERPEFVGWLNYSRMFLDDEVFPIVLRNTLIFAVITGPISYIACLFIAWLINELPKALRTLMTLVFYIPSISGTVFVVWSYIFRGLQWFCKFDVDAVGNTKRADSMADRYSIFLDRHYYRPALGKSWDILPCLYCRPTGNRPFAIRSGTD